MPWRTFPPWRRSGPSSREEVDWYNNHQVHSTTKEIPSIRFERAQNEGNSLFRQFALPKPYTSPKDVFCLRERRMVNAYRRISLFGHEIRVPKAPVHEELELHLIPNEGQARSWTFASGGKIRCCSRPPFPCRAYMSTFEV